MVTVVVTGASGFLGRAVTAALAARPGLCTVAVSRQSLPRATRVADYADAPAGDVLIHLAESADRARVNALGDAYATAARTTVDALLAKRYSRVVYASSAVLYGDRSRTPWDADGSVVPSDMYTHVKRDAELAVLASSGGVVARVSNLYGQGMSPNNVISRIIGQVGSAGPLRVMDTAPVRDFLWVDDAGMGFADLAEADDIRGAFNLGTGIGSSVETVARITLELAGQASRRVVAEAPPRASALVLDYSKTTAACGWRPRTSLRDGLTLLLSRTETHLTI